MIRIKLYKNTNLGRKGDVVWVTGNIAHGLIDRGEGSLYVEKQSKNPVGYKNKMLRSE